ncbi:molybdate ABC transporter substrate-binding protein [Geosporobacter ferrireducens]|uniref:Molybdate ABC transporter substrate-binding protein n=1 Tax=Geosporobacter ferrireducens TaxID=1424294 RepID=A0A1D8GKR6_9FIRM|nr:molybdate ABC transporter substrate-binding protein [Geosporobacter ferrireducens]AOT71473.1 molybdate ABC transporter substrate-binding protein [Geosporobacter ferrireducens]MTI57782.1 molybdate ABC transporter substrate-binding protein [Geosporobacter ferrireducens]
MKNNQKMLLLALILAVILFSTACGQTGTARNAQEGNVSEPKKGEAPVSLTISAAASLKEAMDEIQAAYAEEKPHVTFTYNFGSSGSLQQQIEQGAEVDVFISAAAKQMDALQEKGLIAEETRKNLLENKIVLIVPKGTEAVNDFNDLATDKVKTIALGETASVPVGQYSEEVLTNLNLMDRIKPKAVFGKDVKTVLTWVETGNADAGLVYETDAKVSDKVKVVAKAPEGSHKPVVYPAAVIKDSRNMDAAKDYLDFLCSDKAKSIFEKYGFVFIGK